ncbi:TetR/AcrR family transcriptional regulator [Secundilactobacillus oryzae]|uniref:TetR/AcrR family transcriptional regulator n=1 Tax=Secundilactobacillus oryzae TaxID=1202668 RepID=UPI0006D0900C|nr:TetR/AcrR family transcriptional regulator [Secundilactobacillus oryzae]
MAEKVDLRTRRTKTQIEKAFFELLKNKGFKALTIQDISKLAGVGRSTFYSHYYDKYDLLNKLVARYTSEFEEVVRNRFNIQDAKAGSETIKVLLMVLRQYHENLLLLLDVHTEEADLSHSFQQVLKATVKEYLTEAQKNKGYQPAN